MLILYYAWLIFKHTNLDVYMQILMYKYESRILMYKYESWFVSTNLNVYIRIFMNTCKSWCIHMNMNLDVYTRITVLSCKLMILLFLSLFNKHRYQGPGEAKAVVDKGTKARVNRSLQEIQEQGKDRERVKWIWNFMDFLRSGTQVKLEINTWKCSCSSQLQHPSNFMNFYSGP